MQVNPIPTHSPIIMLTLANAVLESRLCRSSHASFLTLFFSVVHMLFLFQLLTTIKLLFSSERVITFFRALVA